MKPFKYVIDLKGKEKRELRQLKRQGKLEGRLRDRIRLILWSDRGRTTIEEIAKRLDCGRDKVIFWRRRFLEGRAAKQPMLERLQDLPRSGRPPLFSAEQREQVVLATLAHYQAPVRHTSGIVVCSSRDLAEELRQGELGQSISHSTITRLWEAMDIKPWRWLYWLTSPDPDLVAKSRAICRLYHHPPKDGTLLCLDEKPGIQIVERLVAELPVWPGRVARREFEYKRHGTLDLLAALHVQSGWVYGRCYEQHRAVELVEFLDYLDRVLPVSAYGVLHIVSDNLKTRTAPATLEWMEQHPGRVRWHFLPTHASWLNQIEIWFSVLQRKSLSRGSWRSYAELERHILNFIRTYNQRWAHPYRWTYKGLPLAA
jgi:transposase